MRCMVCSLVVGVVAASLLPAQTVEQQMVSSGAVHVLGGAVVLQAGNQQVLQLNAPGSRAPGWSIQRDTGGDRRGLYAVDLQGDRGGSTQVASGDYSVISGGKGNAATGPYSAVGGGQGNTASNWYSTVGGGLQNTAGGLCSTVGGGQDNTTSGQYCTIGGGRRNSASGWNITIGGGKGNTASGDNSTVGGGEDNTASGVNSTVGGGSGNTASGANSTVGGGRHNRAEGLSSTVSGGKDNTAYGQYSTVGGGFGNTTGGNYSVVIGGRYNEANADFVMVFGDNVEPSVAEAYRVYFFGDGSIDNRDRARPSGFLVINRLNGNHPIHVGTNKANGNGAYLSAGGVWTNASSRSKKDRFVPLNAQEVLAKIRQLPVEGWYYAGTNEYHIGPCAEDFHGAFGTGVLDSPDARTSLAASDVAGVALLGIKALAEQVEQGGAAVQSTQEDVEALWRENAALREKTAMLEQKNQVLEQKSQALEQENWELRQKDQLLEQRLAALERLVQELLSCTNAASKLELGENMPNPNGETTTILPQVPASISGAGLQVHDTQGGSSCR